MTQFIKPKDVQEKIIEGGKIIGLILEKLAEMVRPGISTLAIDREAERLIREAGGLPAFKGYGKSKYVPGFPCTICASVNHELVHGIANEDKILKDGDIFTIDIGMQWPKDLGQGEGGNGYFTDTAITVPVGKISKDAQKLLDVTKKALEIGIKQARGGNKLSSIGLAIEKYIEPQGFGIVRELVGHGVGFSVHEEPKVPNFFDPETESFILKPGMVIAIEPMITAGGYEVVTADDEWTIETADRSLCAHFEHTVIITDDEPIIVTKRPQEK